LVVVAAVFAECVELTMPFVMKNRSRATKQVIIDIQQQFFIIEVCKVRVSGSERPGYPNNCVVDCNNRDISFTWVRDGITVTV
jgi:hypothetical protein